MLGEGTGAWKSSLAVSPTPNSANTELTGEPIPSFLSQNPQQAAWLASPSGDSHAGPMGTAVLSICDCAPSRGLESTQEEALGPKSQR